jgi:hypothetical protein
VWTRWDTLGTVRASGLALFALGLGLALTAATDEGNVAWGERIGRTLPLIPVCAAIGVWGALAPVTSRGETVALEALGRTRAQVAGAAVAGGAGVAVIAALAMIATPGLSVDGFYPTVTHTVSWVWRDGTFVDTAHGVQVGADGAPGRTEVFEATPGRLPSVPEHGRAAAALSMALVGIALALLVGDALLDRPASRRRQRDLRRSRFAFLALLGATVVSTIVLFQAAAVRRVPAMAGALPPTALLAAAIQRFARRGG